MVAEGSNQLVHWRCRYDARFNPAPLHSPAKVSVSLASPNSATAVMPAGPGGPPGTWIAKLPATKGGDTAYTVTVTDGTATAKIIDVLFGDVWGQ